MVRARMSGGNRGRGVIGRWVIVAGALLAVMAAGYAVSVHRAKASATGDDELAGSSITQEEVNWIIYWETYDQPPGDLNPIDDDEHPATPTSGEGNGKKAQRIFPCKKVYDDQEAASRRKVFAVAQFTEEPPAGTKVWFRLWDVDDPSDDNGPIDADACGPDNKDGTWAIAGGDGIKMVLVEVGKIKRFPEDGGPTDCDAKHCKVAVKVGMRPGDNFRFAATTPESNKPALQNMTQAQADTALPPNAVKISKVLTVWRKVHLELDSMKDGQDNPVTNKNIDETWEDWPHPGESGAEINGFEPNDDGRYEGGTMVVAGGGTYENIIDHWDSWWPPGDDVVCVVGNCTSDEDKNASFGDDDVCALPRKANWSLLNEKFRPAYIKFFEEPNVSQMNAVFVATIDNSTNTVVAKCEENKQRSTAPDYWVALVLSCHQGKLASEGAGIKSSCDGDPDVLYHIHAGVAPKNGDQFLLYGCSPAVATGKNYCAIFLEACREYGKWSVDFAIQDPQTADNVEKITVCHELGWIFGWPASTPGTIMEDGVVNPAKTFNEDQIKHFRESEEIEK